MLRRLYTKNRWPRLSRFFSESLEQIPYDVCVVGGGIAGLSAAVKLKQLAKSTGGRELSVCVLEKGSEIGSHILSGNVFQPNYLSELFPEWKTMEPAPPLYQPVLSDRFEFLFDPKSKINQLAVPGIFMPAETSNEGNYIISLGALCRWLGERAGELGVDVFTGFAASELVLEAESKRVLGVRTKEFGVSRQGARKENYQAGVEIRAPVTILAEGARGSLIVKALELFGLDRQGADRQSFGLGIKEVWEVRQPVEPGLVLHTVGFPASGRAYSGGFLYTAIDEADRIALSKSLAASASSRGNKKDGRLPSARFIHLGLVVGLDYKNPYVNPYEEFQLWKSHPRIRGFLEGAEVRKYGARVLNEGGYFAVPRLTFPGGLVVGCAAGFLNVLKIKGSHNAMKSGIVAAEAIFARANSASGLEDPSELADYERNMRESSVMQELRRSRNFKAGFKYGTLPGLFLGGLSSLLRGKEFWDLRNDKEDSQAIEPAARHKPIAYPKHDGRFSFDILESVMRSGTHHDHDQPSHLKIRPEKQEAPYESLGKFAGFEGLLKREILPDKGL